MTISTAEKNQSHSAAHKKRYPIAEQQNYCRLWLQSGLTKANFCQQHQLNIKTFYSWINKFNINGSCDEPEKNAPPAFVSIGHNIPLKPSQDKLNVEVILQNGIRVKLQSNNVSQVATFVQGLNHED